MRILIATITAGGGHLQAAAALEEAWRGLRPRDTVEKVDLLEFFSPLHRRIYSEGYVKLVAHAPELWGLLFKATDNPKLVRRLTALRRKLPPTSTMKFLRHARQFQTGTSCSARIACRSKFSARRGRNGRTNRPWRCAS